MPCPRSQSTRRSSTEHPTAWSRCWATRAATPARPSASAACLSTRRSKSRPSSPSRPRDEMLDRAFLRPIAHRGLHNAAKGIVENTTAAFTAAIDKGYGIECDLRPASDGTPFVFHDAEFKRLIDAPGRLDASV